MSYPAPEPTPPPQPSPEADLRHGPAADEIQGNILAGFNKDHQTFLFLQFPTTDGQHDGQRARAWLGDLLPRVASSRDVATFNEQFSHARANNGGDDPTDLKALWVGLSLTGHGLLALASDLQADLANPAFRLDALTRGAAEPARIAALRDDDPADWVVGRADQDIDALVTVAADAPDDLRVELDRQRTIAARRGVVVAFEQQGNTLAGHRRGHEHFGFKDGVSQPGVVGFDEADPENPKQKKDHPGTDLLQPGEFLLGYPGEGGAIRPHAPWMENGSFHVFRRLSQDVPAWWAQAETQRQVLLERDPAHPVSPDLLAAKLVGRWRSGTPLANAPDRDNRSARDRKDDNDFEFVSNPPEEDDDPEGVKTPRFAHIRKMYPRNDAFADNERHRILRRGIPFGLHFDPALGRGHGVDADRGLCFAAFMTSIPDQFEFLQERWANEPNFFDAGDGPDPVIGTDPVSTVTLRRSGGITNQLDFRRFVRTTGAVYLFAPSCSTLRELADGTIRSGTAT